MRDDIPSDLQTHFETRQTTLCWCWRVTLTDGRVLGFTNHDRDLVFDAVTHKASTGFLGTEMESQLGMSVDNMEAYGTIDSEDIREADIEAGLYDNADIQVFLVNWEDLNQRVVMKVGTLGEVRRGETNFQAEIRGLSTQLQQVKGRIYGYSCDALLGDSRCGKDISSATYTGTGAVDSTNSSSYLVASGLGSYETGWFTSGVLTFTSGLNTGILREVKSHIANNGIVSISLWEPMPFNIEVADTFSIAAGCDKTFKTCKAKFNNPSNFRGFPHVPGSDTVIKYAAPGDPNFDGGGNFYGKD